MTLNEEHNIEYCLRSVRSWCTEVIVADMYSEDRTQEIAKRYVDKFISIDRVEGFDAGRRKAFDNATGDWILSIDADEIITPKLADWIMDYVGKDPEIDLIRIPRANVFLGRWVRSSPWWPGKPRLFRPDAIEVTGQLHHGLMPRPGIRIADVPRDPDLSMWHFTFQSIAGMVDKSNRYTSIEARQAIEAGNDKVRVTSLFIEPLKIFGVYLMRRGWRDGLAGLAWTFDRMYYRFLSLIKRWDERQVPTRQNEYDKMREEILAGFPAAGRREGESSQVPDAAS